LVALLLVACLASAVEPTGSEAVPTRTPLPASTRAAPNRIAFRRDRDGSEGGDLWVVGADGSNERPVTRGQSILGVHGWSPDNAYVAVTLLAPSDAALEQPVVAAVDVGSGEVIPLGRLPSERPAIIWYGPDALAYVFQDRVDVLAFPEGAARETLSIPVETERAIRRLLPSPDRTCVAFEAISTIGETRVDLYAWCTGDAQSTPLSTNGKTYLGTWREDSVVYHVYQDRASIGQVRPRGSARRTLVDLDHWAVLDMSGSADGSVLFYSVEDRETCCGQIAGKLYVYDSHLSETRIVYTLPKNTTAIGLGVSADGEYASFSMEGLREKPLYIVRTSTAEVIEVCEDACFQAQWSL
jgi:hypothetical protein